MGDKNEIMLNENQHRLLMCCRIANALDKSEIYPSTTESTILWRLEKNGCTSNVFRSIDEMEKHLDQLLEERRKNNPLEYKAMDSRIKRRINIIHERNESCETGRPMTFLSQINR